MNVRSPSLGRDEAWGFLALIPVIISLIIGISFNGFNKPLSNLANQLNNNNSRILFLFYGLLPFILAAIYDETVDSLVLPLYCFLILLVIISVLLYLNAKNKKVRNWSSVLGFIVPIVIAILTSPHLDKYKYPNL